MVDSYKTCIRAAALACSFCLPDVCASTAEDTDDARSGCQVLISKSGKGPGASQVL